MKTVKFNVQGSDTERAPYEVQFFFENNVLSGNCDCGAGLKSQVCSHRIGVLEGTRLPINGNLDELEALMNWYSGSDVQKLVSEQKVLIDEKKAIDDASAKLKKKIEAMRVDLSNLLKR